MCGRRVWPHARRGSGCDGISCRHPYRRSRRRRTGPDCDSEPPAAGERRKRRTETPAADARPAADRKRGCACGESARLLRDGRGVDAKVRRAEAASRVQTGPGRWPRRRIDRGTSGWRVTGGRRRNVIACSGGRLGLLHTWEDNTKRQGPGGGRYTRFEPLPST